MSHRGALDRHTAQRQRYARGYGAGDCAASDPFISPECCLAHTVSSFLQWLYLARQGRVIPASEPCEYAGGFLE